MVLSGTVAQFNQAFAVDLRRFQHPGGAYRGRIGPIQLPEELTGVVEAVLGLDNRPQARTQFRIRPPSAGAAPAAFTPPQVAALYDYPTGGGEGQCIGLIELGGGYRPADLSAYFAGLGIDPPAVTAVSVDRGENSPTGDASGPDGEVMLDIEIAGSVASGAAIAVYFAPNTDAGFVDAVSVAAHDQTNRPSILSISWGGPEASWTAQAMTALDEAFQAAAAMGVSICVASGDHGSSDGLVNGSDNVDFPASSPHALACGGTSLRASGRRSPARACGTTEPPAGRAAAG
jgi:kumamolisin